MVMKVIDTEDGSKTIHIEEINETYHSIHGALQESLHVYIKNGFRYSIGENLTKPLSVLEVGLGTGLNVILTLIESNKFKLPVKFTSLEPFPLPPHLINQLNYDALFPSQKKIEDVFKLIHSEIWGDETLIGNYLKFRKLQVTIQEFDLQTDKFDLIYYDAFAPGKQPEMWHFNLFNKIFNAMNPGGILVTYSAQGQFKRDLKEIGFKVEVLSGPPGKKEMVRAIRN